VAEEESGEVNDDPVAFLRRAAPWLLDPALGICIVGSNALAIACARADLPGPAPADLDLSWALDPNAGARLLGERGALMATTDGNLGRGTVAAKLGERRIEITTLRAGDARAPLPQRIDADLRARDMSIGALAVEPGTGLVHDPTGGLDDWRQRRIVAVGEPADRVREHPVRWLRYYRKAHQLGFTLDRRVRALDLPPGILRDVPTEAIALELRAGLERCPSPGRFFLELHEAGLLRTIAPELAPQFDGRPAGPQRFHPEVSQALHMVLCLEWAVQHCTGLEPRDRTAVLIAVLCHDLGKGFTKERELPSHPGHERKGRPFLERLLDRLPGFSDARARALAIAVCELHVDVRKLYEMRVGTLARFYDHYFRQKDFPVELFALAVGADSGGRLGLAAEGEAVCARVARELHWLRRVCESVDATALRAKFTELTEFKGALHETRARALSAAMDQEGAPVAK
jgi:tRNA nucleotidyltransferase (CCA-adding enzyme)